MSTTNNRRQSGLLWARPEPGTSRPRFTRERIAEVAILIAEKEGIEALSMRRLAQELDAGTMTLYYYLSSKRDLLAYIEDQIIGEIVIENEEPKMGWREALARLARRACAVWMRRSWAVMSVRTPYIGPNGMRYFERSLAALADCPLSAAEKLQIISLVDNYVLGFVMRESALRSSQDEWTRDVSAFMTAQIETGRYPHVRQLIGTNDILGFIRQLGQATPEERFEHGLALILDGVAAQLRDGARDEPTAHAKRRPGKLPRPGSGISSARTGRSAGKRNLPVVD